MDEIEETAMNEMENSESEVAGGMEQDFFIGTIEQSGHRLGQRLELKDHAAFTSIMATGPKGRGKTNGLIIPWIKSLMANGDGPGALILSDGSLDAGRLTALAGELGMADRLILLDSLDQPFVIRPDWFTPRALAESFFSAFLREAPLPGERRLVADGVAILARAFEQGLVPSDRSTGLLAFLDLVRAPLAKWLEAALGRGSPVAREIEAAFAFIESGINNSRGRSGDGRCGTGAFASAQPRAAVPHGLSPRPRDLASAVLERGFVLLVDLPAARFGPAGILAATLLKEQVRRGCGNSGFSRFRAHLVIDDADRVLRFGPSRETGDLVVPPTHLCGRLVAIDDPVAVEARAAWGGADAARILLEDVRLHLLFGGEPTSRLHAILQKIGFSKIAGRMIADLAPRRALAIQCVPRNAIRGERRFLGKVALAEEMADKDEAGRFARRAEILAEAGFSDQVLITGGLLGIGRDADVLAEERRRVEEAARRGGVPFIRLEAADFARHDPLAGIRRADPEILRSGLVIVDRLDRLPSTPRAHARLQALAGRRGPANGIVPRGRIRGPVLYGIWRADPEEDEEMNVPAFLRRAFGSYAKVGVAEDLEMNLRKESGQ
jgi:hypothetical protein